MLEENKNIEKETSISAEEKLSAFPAGFFWGAATAAHQVEGNTNNNWIQWEKDNAQHLALEAKKKWAEWQQKKFTEMFDLENYVSGRACDHYHLFEKDFDLAKEGGHNAHRFSIEWARIEPREGEFDEKEIEHYRSVLKAILARDLEPFVTLWHWTEPVWFNNQGGWNNKKSIEYFQRFVEKVVDEYKDLVKFWIVVNEPNVSMGFGYFLGAQPPGKKGITNFISGYLNLLKAAQKASLVIKKINPKSEIGMANSVTDYQVKIIPGLNFLIESIIKFFSQYFLRKTLKQCTFIGLNYYSRHMVSFKKMNSSPEETTDLGWEIYPQGIFNVLLGLKKYNLPIYITENGIADASDEKRPDFIKQHITFIQQAIEKGVQVQGYFHWSFLDNFEFPELRGFWPRFGLVEIDYQTLERKPRKSFYVYKEIIKNAHIEN